MTDEGLINLSNAIVARAAEDYAIAFMGGDIGTKKPKDTMEELERWVHTDYYHLLTNVDGDWLLKNIKIRELETVLKAYKAAFKIDNHPSFKLTVNTPKGQDNINFIIPPRLAEAFMAVLTSQIRGLEKELKEINGYD